jgi:hypothetical protein
MRNAEGKGLLASFAADPSKNSEDRVNKTAELERRGRFVADRLLMVAAEMQRSSVFDDPESEARVRDESIDRMIFLAAILKGEKAESDYESLLLPTRGSTAAGPEPGTMATGDSFELSATGVSVGSAVVDNASKAVISDCGSDAPESIMTGEARNKAVSSQTSSSSSLSSSASSSTAAPLSSTYTPGPFRSPPPSNKRTIFVNRAIDSDDEFSPLSLK